MNEKILVINDDDGIREMISLILQAKGYAISEARNGKEGIEKAIQEIPDLILLDIMMPEMDGYEACTFLKSNPITKEIPIIFLSSLNMPKQKIKGLELGAVDFINNVVDQGELLARVQTHLKIKSLTDELVHKNQQLLTKQEILDENLNAAVLIQSSFLPSKEMKLNLLDIAWLWLPAYTLGGDIFNVIRHNGKIVFYMVDVSGHDVPSALVTISVSQFLHQENSPHKPIVSPKEMMNELDKEYPMERFNRFFTIFYFIYDQETKKITYSCAGHPPAIILSKKGVRFMENRGTIIGLNLDYPFEEAEETVAVGDKILLYTDGLVEQRNDKDQSFGMERLVSLLEKIKGESVSSIIKKIDESQKEFKGNAPIQDDVSLMIVEIKN